MSALQGPADAAGPRKTAFQKMLLCAGGSLLQGTSQNTDGGRAMALTRLAEAGKSSLQWPDKALETYMLSMYHAKCKGKAGQQ